MANTTGKKFGGRKKGTQNKNTTELKTAIMAAFDTVGGQDYLVGVAKDDPKTFCTLLGRVLPSELKAELSTMGEDGMPTGFKVQFVGNDTSNT
tara:strand:+ start:496 stop:774 length:279 start_codon:yes stop_codon:yes gene_type:complete